MIFLSAQPDATYFIWQVELQLFNLEQLNWPKENIHVLFSYAPDLGINPEASLICKKFPNHHIYFYEDTRVNKKYSSTIRPHIIEKHFALYPDLRKETIFYIDSDVIFKELPDFSTLLNDDIWYASDTRSYMGSEVLINALGYETFKHMCDIVGVSTQDVMKNEINTGGAQYIIKNIPLNFWSKVEKDSNEMYEYLHDVLFVNTSHDFLKKYPISIWLTEMWVVFWNTILFGKTFVTHPLLNFCWAYQTTEKWENSHILHYTGGTKGNFFKKINYTYASPFYEDLSYIDKNSCSAVLKDLILLYRSYLNKNRFILNDITIIIPIQDKPISIPILDYLIKYIKSNFIILGSSFDLKTSKYESYKNIKFIKQDNVDISNIAEELSTIEIKTNYIGIIPSHYILPIQQLIRTVYLLQESNNQIIQPYTRCLKIDTLSHFLFQRVLEEEFLFSNIGKFEEIENKYKNECLFFHKEKFKNSIKKEIEGYIFIK